MLEGFKERAAQRRAQHEADRAEYQKQRAEQQKQQDERQQREAVQEAAHFKRIKTAAGVASIMITCHKDTWITIHRLVSVQRHEWRDIDHQATYVDETQQMVSVLLSGPAAAIALEGMRSIFTSKFGHGGPEYEKALASRYYEALADVIDSVSDQAEPGAPVPRLVLDARPQATPAEDAAP